MKKHLNTLYVTTEGLYLSKDGECVAVKERGKTKLRIPVHTLSGIVCLGRVGCSPYLMGFCAEKKVGISFLSKHGRFLARIKGSVSGNVLLRREQYRRSDDTQKCAEIIRTIIAGKVANSRTVLQRALRDRPESEQTAPLQTVHQRLSFLLNQWKSTNNPDQLRGFEGDAARAYYRVFDHLISSQKDDFSFSGRNRRPPKDNVNALLSFVYTLLTHDVTSALEAVGLDPQVGFLHRDRPGRASLALDLMEELRPVLADRLVLSLINLRQVQARGFTASESGAVMMDDETRKTVLMAWQKRKEDTLRHPYLGETITVGLIPHIQAQLFARYLRGDLDAYPPFVWK